MARTLTRSIMATAPRDWYRFTAAAGDETVDLSIFGPIGGGFCADEDAPTGKKFAAQLDALPDAVKTIRVRVNSPGGAVFDAIHIANALRRQSAEKGRTVEVLIEALAGSAATLITSAGDSIKMPRNAVLMVHMPSGLVLGPASLMRKTAEALERVTDSIVATYRWVSHLSAEQLRALMEATTWMGADEALKNGFVTEITDPVKAVASVDSDDVAKLGPIPELYRFIFPTAMAGPMPASAEEAATPMSTPKKADKAKLAKHVVEALDELGIAEPTEEQATKLAARLKVEAKSPADALAALSPEARELVVAAQREAEAAKVLAAEAQALATRERAERLQRDYIARAGMFKGLPIKADDDWKVFQAIDEKLTVDEAKRVWQLLAAADAAMVQAGLFKQSGAVGGDVAADPWMRIEQLADQLVAKDAKLTKPKAIDQALQTAEGKQLYDAYKAARSGGA